MKAICENKHQLVTYSTNIPRDELGPPKCPRCDAPMQVTSNAEMIAAAFHETYERLAPTMGYETRPESRCPWPEVPAANRELMIAVVRDLTIRGVIAPGDTA